MMRLVTRSDPAWAKGESFGRNGAEGMNWTQNNSPDRKNVDSIRLTCRSGLVIIGLKRLGSIQSTITALKKMMPTAGDNKNAQTRRSG